MDSAARNDETAARAARAPAAMRSRAASPVHTGGSALHTDASLHTGGSALHTGAFLHIGDSAVCTGASAPQRSQALSYNRCSGSGPEDSVELAGSMSATVR